MLSQRMLTRQVAAQRRHYSTPKNPYSAFYYKFGTPLVKCTVLATGTTMAWQLLWQHLEYQEFRDESEQHIAKLEDRIKSLEEQRQAV